MVDRAVEAFKDVHRTSEVKEAEIVSVTARAEGTQPGQPHICIQVLWDSYNLASLEKTVTCSSYHVQGETVVPSQPMPVSTTVGLHRASGSGRLTAYLQTSEKEEEEEHMLVVGQEGTLTTIDLKEPAKHGKVYKDGFFSCLEWSPDESTLVYVAEKKYPKPSSFVKPVKSDEDDARGQEYMFRDDWGEQLEGKHQSVVCFLNVMTGNILCHELPEGMCAAQLVWAADGTGVFGVAFVPHPYRIGTHYCQNIESKLFYMDRNGNFSVVSEGSRDNIQSPRVSPDGGSVAFLRAAPVLGTHNKGTQLCLLSWPSKQERVVIDIVAREQKLADGHIFKGLYDHSLPRRCWTQDSRYILFSTFNQHQIVTYTVDVESSELVAVPHQGSLVVLDVHHDWLLASSSSLTRPAQILLARLPDPGHHSAISFQQVCGQRQVPGVAINYQARWLFTNTTPHPDPRFSDIPISVLYFGPTSLEQGAPKRPLICWPHGGPHAFSPDYYDSQAAFFVRMGYSIVFPNFRGSMGFGQDGIDSLPGHCGVTDVSDCHQATLSCLERYGDVLDKSRVFLFGWSHGGFLVCHLAAQYPEFYKAVAAQNAVTNIAAISAVTDIPEWAFVEAGLDFHHGKMADGEALTKMLAASPLSVVDRVKAPVLLCVGKNDRRCPPSQSFHYHKMLRARGVPTKLLVYDDCHSLQKVAVDMDMLINSALWFDQHSRPSPQA